MTNLQVVNISGEPWTDFLIRLVVNIVSLFCLIRFIYYPNNSREKYLFTFFLMGMMIFLIASLLDRVSLDVGLALGLFAIFGIVRYRSPSIDLKEMTYLFLVIGISIINALVAFNVQTLAGLFIANFIIIASALIMENYKPRKYLLKKPLVYQPVNYSVLNDNKSLLNEIREETGIDVVKVEIEKINKAKNEVMVWIYFKENNPQTVKSNNKELNSPNTNAGWEITDTNNYQ